MGLIGRLERNIAKLEKRIEKEQMKIENLHEKCERKKITKAEFNIKEKHIEKKIHAMKSEMGSLHGEIAKAKRDFQMKPKLIWNHISQIYYCLQNIHPPIFISYIISPLPAITLHF